MGETTRRSTERAALRFSRRAGLRAAGAGLLTLAGARVLPARAQQPRSNGIAVYPAHNTRTASPGTEISFRGVSASQLGPLSVVGSRSGGHSGIVVPHADGNGASFLPDARFEPGEAVTVSAALPLRRSTGGAIRFSVATPAPLVSAPPHRETEAPEREPQAFRSRPDLRPPVIDVTTPPEETAPGQVFLAPKIEGGQSGAMILDERGELVWFATPAADVNQCNDFRVQTYLGQPVLTWWEGASPVGHGYGHFVIANSAYERITELRAGNGFPGGDLHEFLITPQGTALILVYHPVRWNLTPFGGPIDGAVMDGIVQEIDIATGRVLFEWHSLDHIDLDEAGGKRPDDPDRPWDYVHLNAIELDGDHLVVSARNSHAIYRIDRVSGRVVWRLGGKRNDFAMAEGASFAYQHDARVHPNGELTLFDNAETDLKAGGHSRGLVLRLDEERMTAALVREYVHPTKVLSISQGNVQVLPNGNVFVGWGSSPVFSEFGPDGELRFNGRLPAGAMSYRAYRAPWVGRPSAPPDIAAEAGAGGAVTIYASWNGATEVAHWRVLAGPEPAGLGFVRSAPRAGFETAIALESGAGYVAVEALDAAGQVLGRSEVAAV